MKKLLKKIIDQINEINRFINEYYTLGKSISLPSRAYMNWGISLAKTGDIDQALEKLETSTLMPSKSADIIANLGIALAKKGLYDEAIDKFKEAIKTDSKYVKAYSLLAAALAEQSRDEEAWKYYEKATELSKNNPETYISWGISLAKLGRKEEAEDKFRTAYMLNPLSIQAVFLWGVVCSELFKFDEALEKFKIVIEHNPNHFEAFYYKALCLAKKEKYKEAEESAKISINLYPQKAETYIVLAKSYMGQNEYEKAFECYLQAEKHNPELLSLYLSWAESLQKIDLFESSIEKLKIAEQIDADDTTMQYYMAIALAKTAQYGDATIYMLKAAKKQPKDPHIITELGKLYLHNMKPDKAIACFTAVAKKNRTNTQINYNLACAYKLKENFEIALRYYNKMIEYNPEHISSYIESANIYSYLDNHKEAIRKMRKAYQIKKDNLAVIFEYAKTLMRAKDFNNAIEKLDLITEKDPGFIPAFLCKAESMVELGKYDDAMWFLGELKAKYPESDEVLHFYSIANIEVGDRKNDRQRYVLAEESLKTLVEKNPDNVDYVSNFAYTKARLGDMDTFESIFRDLIKNRPEKLEIIHKYLKLALEKLDFMDRFDTFI